MCGIAGIAAKRAIENKSRVKKMTDSLAHRGPDGEGVFAFESCALGHRRLSIVDLSTGDQPMFSADGKLGIVFNGEIYGYKEIKAKEFPNYNFRTTSDTELILALYEKYGEKTPEHLPGIFSFALWDERNQKLFCARDRFGEKPFYYAIGENGEFLFASEIKAIISSGIFSPKLDRAALAQYLQRLYVGPNYTIYKNVSVLPPAHALVFKNERVEVRRYWGFPDVNPNTTFEEALPKFKELFENSVKNQLVADVPVGAFLSGGLDSSTVVAVASKYKKNLKTFSFAFRDSINELPFAREIAKKYSTDHTELFDDGEPLGSLLLKMSEVYDEPFSDSSNIPTYLLSKLASEHAKVVLTGDGGDELLGGYGGYRPLSQMSNGAKGILWRNKLVWLMGRVIAKSNLPQKNYLLHRHLGAEYAHKFNSVLEAHLAQGKVFNSSQLKELGFEEELIPKYKPSWELTKSLDDALRADLETYMPGDILVKTDRASMASGLELRAPFLDVEFASFCISLPHSLKVNRGEEKYILRRAFEQTWTDSIKKRNKQGFGAPITKWLKDDSIAKLRREYLGDRTKKIFKLLPFEAVQKLSARNNYQTWNLLSLALWAESHEFEYE